MRNEELDYNKGNGLIPVIIQDYKTGQVYMLGFMNKEAFEKTIDTGWVYFWSRSRQKLWMKGKESGNKLKAIEIFADCDCDTILIKAKLLGSNVCHTGEKSCFFKKINL